MERHNPYFNRWFSAIQFISTNDLVDVSHNPYFNRWFSAITKDPNGVFAKVGVTILILIDGFLQ